MISTGAYQSRRGQLATSRIQEAQPTIGDFEEEIAEAMKQHPDAHLFTNLRGAGDALAPRLLCTFGSQRDRREDADEIGSFSGIAPLTIKSGKSRGAYRRRACPRCSGKHSTNSQTVHDGFAPGGKLDTTRFATAASNIMLQFAR